MIKVEKIKTKVKKDKGDPAKRAAAAAARKGGVVAQLDEGEVGEVKEEVVLGGVEGVAEKLEGAKVE